jgi:hypothetical protein
MNKPLLADTVPPGWSFAACSAVIGTQRLLSHMHTCVNDGISMTSKPNSMIQTKESFFK